MAFPETIKLQVKQRAHFMCCICREPGPIEVHHILPQAEGGSDSDENAAPLCPRCHEIYGANETKRKYVRECRDLWLATCAKRYATDSERLDELKAILSSLPNKSDLSEAVHLLTAQHRLTTHAQLPASQLDMKRLLSVPLTNESLKLYLRWMFPHIPYGGRLTAEALLRDIVSIGYTNVASLHRIIGDSREAISEYAQDLRDEGEPVDTRMSDTFVVILFLSVLDAQFCALRYPNVYAKEPNRKWKRKADSSISD